MDLGSKGQMCRVPNFGGLNQLNQPSPLNYDDLTSSVSLVRNLTVGPLSRDIVLLFDSTATNIVLNTVESSPNKTRPNLIQFMCYNFRWSGVGINDVTHKMAAW